MGPCVLRNWVSDLHYQHVYLVWRLWGKERPRNGCKPMSISDPFSLNQCLGVKLPRNLNLSLPQILASMVVMLAVLLRWYKNSGLSQEFSQVLKVQNGWSSDMKIKQALRSTNSQGAQNSFLFGGPPDSTWDDAHMKADWVKNSNKKFLKKLIDDQFWRNTDLNNKPQDEPQKRRWFSWLNNGDRNMSIELHYDKTRCLILIHQYYSLYKFVISVNIIRVETLHFKYKEPLWIDDGPWPEYTYSLSLRSLLAMSKLCKKDSN